MAVLDCDLHLVTGEVTHSVTEFFFPAQIPCYLARRYSSADRSDGPFGHGWTHNLQSYIHADSVSIVMHGAGEAPTAFVHPSDGIPVVDDAEIFKLRAERLWWLVTDPDGQTWAFERAPDPRGHSPLVALADIHGNRITFDYDSRGNLTRIEDAEHRDIRFSSDTEGRIVAIAVSHPQLQPEQLVIARFVYDQRGDLVAAYDQSGVPVRYEYDSHYLVRVINRWGGSQYFGYDADGQAIARWRSDGTLCRFIRRDLDGRLLEVTDSYGERWISHLDDQGNVVAKMDPLHRTREDLYDASGGLVLAGIDSRGGNVVTLWDAATRSETIVCGASQRVVTYNGFEKPVKVVDSEGNTWVYEYNDKGLLIRVISPDESECRLDYSARGELATFTDPAGNIVRVSRTTSTKTVEDSLGRLATSAYDVFGRPLAFRDAAGAYTRFEWNVQGQLDKLILPNESVYSFAYDAAGYPTEISYPNGSRLQLESGTFGRPTALRTANGGRYQILWDREDRHTG